MNELRSILEARRSSAGQLAGAVLASVVHVQGSAYRRPGARMLIFPDGRRIGTISGGCLEGDVARKSRWWLSQSPSALRTYDTSSEGAAWEFGLGCNGVITVLLEPADSPSVDESLEFIDQNLARRQGMVIATVLRARPGEPCVMGDRLLCDDSGPVGGCLRGSHLENDLALAIETTRSERTSRLVSHQAADVFVEWIGPTQRLVVFGAGHDVVPVLELSAVAGWDVTIVETRPGFDDPSRFPGAERVTVLPASASIDGISIDADTAVVMMTHNYPLDLVLLPQVLARSPRYVGVLGPRDRAVKLFAEAGMDLNQPGVHSPAGLDIGSDHPETIALSIVAEIQAALEGRAGGSLRLREGPIHGPVLEMRGPNSPSPNGTDRTIRTACQTIGGVGYV